MCECNGRTYANRAGLIRHQKTAAEHKMWETVKELRDERCRRTLLENHNAALKKEIAELNEELRRVYRRIILQGDTVE